MVRFRLPRPPYWLAPRDEREIDFYLKDYMRYRGDFVENLSPQITEQYTSFLNQPQILQVWNTITSTTIPLPIIVADYYATSTRMPNSRKSVEEVYEEDFSYTIKFPFSPIIADVLGRYHPIEVCALSCRDLNGKLDNLGPIHLRLRHRRCTVFGVAQVVLEPKEEYWLSEGVWLNIPRYLLREWGIHVKNPHGPYVYIKNEPGSLYPIDLVHNLEDESEVDTQERQKVEKEERWHALLFTANRIARVGHSTEYKPEDDKKIERLARRFIQIVLNS